MKLSASLLPGGMATRAYNAVVSNYVVDELRSVYARMFPAKTAALDAFLAALASSVEIVFTPEEEGADDEGAVRYPTNRPVFRATRHAAADVLLTGDKDLFEAAVRDPRVVCLVKPGFRSGGGDGNPCLTEGFESPRVHHREGGKGGRTLCRIWRGGRDGDPGAWPSRSVPARNMAWREGGKRRRAISGAACGVTALGRGGPPRSTA